MASPTAMGGASFKQFTWFCLLLRSVPGAFFKDAPPIAVGEAMRPLLEDANLRIRLIAAGSLLAADSGDAKAGAVLVEALSDPSPRLRKAALELVESLGAGGGAFLEDLKKREELEVEPELRDVVARLIERLTPQVEANLLSASG